MARKAKRARSAKPAVTDHAAVAEIVDLVEVGRRDVARTINATMTAVYWAIGRRIVLEEQHGTRRAEYGEALIHQLAARLTARFGRGFSTTNLKQMRSFYLAFPEIGQTASDQSRIAGTPRDQIGQTASGESDVLAITARLPLP